MSTILEPEKPLTFSGIPVICRDCCKVLYKDSYKKCNGDYLCAACKDKRIKR